MENSLWGHPGRRAEHFRPEGGACPRAQGAASRLVGPAKKAGEGPCEQMRSVGVWGVSQRALRAGARTLLLH